MSYRKKLNIKSLINIRLKRKSLNERNYVDSFEKNIISLIYICNSMKFVMNDIKFDINIKDRQTHENPSPRYRIPVREVPWINQRC